MGMRGLLPPGSQELGQCQESIAAFQEHKLPPTIALLFGYECHRKLEHGQNQRRLESLGSTMVPELFSLQFCQDNP